MGKRICEVKSGIVCPKMAVADFLSEEGLTFWPFFKEDIKKLSALLNRDLTHWTK